MAVNDPTNEEPTPTPAPTPAPVVTLDPANATSKALADAAVLAEKQQNDEGDEGGHYMIGDRHVNANGETIKKTGKDKDGKTRWEVVKDAQPGQ